MIKVKFSPDGGFTMSFDPDWVKFILTTFSRPPSEASLNYTTAHAEAAYPDMAGKTIAAQFGNHKINAPYICLIDYRKSSFANIGNFKTIGKYSLPGELALLRESEINQRESKGKLKKRDQPAVRVADLIIGPDNTIDFFLQEASYYDQVGSNLSLDARLPTTLGLDISSTPTARSWDKIQSGSKEKLPSLADSRLANTIGIAVGIRTIDSNGRPAFVIRKRGPNVDVYPDMWHLPFSFALSYTPPMRTSGTIEELINFDYAHELLQETGLEPSEISNIRPLVFARDLIRGGKPQFFLEMESTLKYEELSERMKNQDSGEYRGDSRLVLIGEVPNFVKESGSPELLGYICLCSSQNR